MKDLSLTEARAGLLRLADEIERDPSMVVEIRKRGRRVMALVSAELYDALMETLDVLGEPAAAGRLRQALQEVEQGKGVPWKAAKKRLGLAE